MIFLIDYDNKAGLQSMRTFSDAAQEEASLARFDLESLYRRQGIAREVVLLQASNEQTIRKTHARYFDNPQELERRLESVVRKAS